jgi:tetratricopeptide (TPR) repeat protein
VKVCLSCNHQYDAELNACPKCGSINSMMSVPTSDAQSLLDFLGKTDEAYEHVKTAQLLMKGKKYQQAKSELETAIRIDPKYDFSYAIMGMLCCDQEQYYEAIPWFKKVLELQPKECKGITEILATILAATGKKEEAIKILKKKLSVYPNDEKTQEILGKISAASG